MARIEKTKIKQVNEINSGGTTLTTITLLEPTTIFYDSGRTERVSKITIKGGKINKESDWDKEGKIINFENRIDDNKIKVVSQTALIDNVYSEINLKIIKTDEEKIINWINNGFSIIFERNGYLVNPNEDPDENFIKTK